MPTDDAYRKIAEIDTLSVQYCSWPSGFGSKVWTPSPKDILPESMPTCLVLTIALIFILNALDSIIACKRNETSKIGVLLDILADPIIENTFWGYCTDSEPPLKQQSANG